MAQGLADDVDPHLFARRVLSSAPDGDFKHRRHRKDYLFKTFLICTQLKSMRTMPELLYDVASLLFGTQTRAGMQGLIEAAANLQISRSVLSKSRILFDGVFMVHSRERYMKMRAAGGCVRYFMADSSSQHDREFESVWTMCIEKASIVNALKISNDLIRLSKAIGADGA